METKKNFDIIFTVLLQFDPDGYKVDMGPIYMMGLSGHVSFAKVFVIINEIRIDWLTK